MQTQHIRSRRNRANWIPAAFAIFIPLYLILFLQHGVTKAQSEDPTATSTETSAYPGTDTDTPTYLETLADTPTETLFPLVSPTDTDTETPTLTNTESPTATQTATDGFVTSHITNQIIVRYKTGSQAASNPKREDQMQRVNNAAGVSMEHRRTMSGGAQIYHFQGKHSAKEIQAIADKLKKLPEVEYAEPDWVLYPTRERAETLPVLESRPLFFVPNDPYYVYQWHYFETYGINAEAAWDITTGSTSVTVAVIDTGITNHSEFTGRIVPGYDFINDAQVANDGDGRDSDPSDPGDWITQAESDEVGGFFEGCQVGDSSWHGTHTAGTIGASGNNGSGVAGIDWQAKILPVRVLGKCGGYTSDIVDGMRWAAGLTVSGVPANANPAKVLSISLGGQHACGTTTQTAINEIIAAGSVVVVAAGNNNMDASGFGPGNCNGVITVAGTNREGQRAYYSNYGTTVEISAPGGDFTSSGYDGVLSTWNTGTQGPDAESYVFMQGTSMSAPHVSGVVSLMFAVDPTLTPAEVLTVLQSTVTAFPAGGSCTTANCGSGIVNAGAAVASLLTAETNTPTTTITPTQYTPTNTSTRTPTRTLTMTLTRTRTVTPTPVTPTSTVTPTRTVTQTPVTPTSTSTFTPTNTLTRTPYPPTFTPTVTNTLTRTPTPSNTVTNTPTATRTPTDTATPSVTVTGTPPTPSSLTATMTDTETPTETNPVGMNTVTPSSTITPTLTRTLTITPTPGSPTSTRTLTITPTTYTQTSTLTRTSTITPTSTSPSQTPTATNTPTETASPGIVLVTVLDTNENPEGGITVQAFVGSTNTGISAKTDGTGHATLTLPAGNYRFRVVKNGTAFWSGTADHCTIPGCTSASITTTVPVTITVLNLDGQPEAGISVLAYNGTTYAGYSAYTNAQGQVSFTLPVGSYRFRAAKNSRFFWSGGSNHCAVPGCTAATITVDNTVIVTVLDTDGNPEAGLNVLVYNGSTYAGYAAYTNAQGQAALALPAGSYRFRAAKNGTAFYSGTANHCTVPGCTSASITTTVPVTVTVLDLAGTPDVGLTVQVYNGSTYFGYTATTNAQGQVSYTLPAGSYRFRTYKNSRTFWSGAENHCAIPGCTASGITTNSTVTVTVLDSVGNPVSGINVQAFDGSTFAGHSLYTNTQGQSAMALPAGNYRFRVVKNGTAFWSGPANHCTVPGCSSASITVSIPVVVTVLNLDGQPEAGISVLAYNGSTYAGYSGTTNAQGQVTFTMADGSYRFRAAKNNRFFWSGTENHCTVPGCTSAAITVDNTVVVTVLDTGGNPEAGLNVLAYNGSTYAGFAAYTNAQGQASLALPAGSYRFRVAKNGTAFWSGTSNHCTIPGCTSAGITTTIPVVVTVLDAGSNPEPGLTVQAYNGSTYAGYSAVTNAQGQVSFTLPTGSYRFRTIQGSDIFWSGMNNHCAVPGCEAANITTGAGALAVSTGMYWTTCAITDLGDVKCWGSNIAGQIGDGTTQDRFFPTSVVGLSSPVQAISTAFDHTCALTASGGVKCWGDNEFGALGDGTNEDRLTPVDVSGLTSGVTAVSVGMSFSCALTTGGGVKCWGMNYEGQLGDGTCSAQSAVPMDVAGLTSGVTAISAGTEHACAVLATGGIKCWGANFYGQLGDGTYDNHCGPVDVVGLGNATMVSSGMFSTCAVTTGGGAKCWGENGYVGELGNGTYDDDSPIPTDVVGLTSGVTAIAMGDGNACAITAGGRLKCWGDNGYYQLRFGIDGRSNVPVDRLEFPGNVISVSVGSADICIISSNHQLTCWGGNWHGEVGNGSASTVTSPFNVPL